jgi:UDP-N-acetylglucosamine 4,6-dehydratase
MACEIAGNVYPIEETGLRPGEKLHEMLISEADARMCYRTEFGWTIYPEAHEWTATIVPEGNKVRPEFRYSSNDQSQK